MSFTNSVQTTTRDNLGQPRLGICAVGPTKAGKSELVASMPEPIVVWSDETNNENLEGHMRDGRDITIHSGLGQDWEFYRSQFIPAVTNREIAAATIAIEGFAFRDQSLVQHLGLDTPSRDTIAKWGRKLVMSRNTMRDLLSARQPHGDHPGYNIVLTVHLSEVNRKVGDDLVFDHYACHVAGSFKEDLPKMFGLSLLLDSTMEAKVEKVGGQNKTVRRHKYIGYTVPPSNSYPNLCGDNMGGKGGFDRLPAQFEDPNFHTLCRLWNVEETLFK